MNTVGQSSENPSAPRLESSRSARYGWASSFGTFRETPSVDIRGSLADFLRNVSDQQVRAWDESIPPLQDEVGELIDRDSRASEYSAILEYELPMELRRPEGRSRHRPADHRLAA